MRNVFLLVMITASLLHSDQYWVDDNGAASWESAKSSTPLSGTACCLLSTANTNAVGSDTIWIRGGVYSTGIKPSNSGSAGNVISYKNYNNETVVIRNSSVIAIWLLANYIKVEGITVDSCQRLGHLENANYNEISYCHMTGYPELKNGAGGFRIGNAGSGTDYSTNNYIHHCFMTRMGWVGDDCNDESNLIQIGLPYGVDTLSNYNTFDACTLSNGGHHVLEVNTDHNVVRDCIIQNYGWMDSNTNCTSVYYANINHKFGNRCLTTNNGMLNNTSKSGGYNFFENNRLGPGGRPPDDDGSECLTLSTFGNLARFNKCFSAGQMGVFIRDSLGDSNFIFRNTVFYNAQAEGSDYDDPGGIMILHNYVSGNSLSNNIVYGNREEDIGCVGAVGWCSWATNDSQHNNWETANGYPEFDDSVTSDFDSYTQPGLKLTSSSPCRNAGSAVTVAVGSGTNTTKIRVADPRGFQDGSYGSSIATLYPDIVAIGSIFDTVTISSINLSTDTITLAKNMTWDNGDSIWLVKNSSNSIVLYGTAPDVGADEFVEGFKKPARIVMERQ